MMNHPQQLPRPPQQAVLEPAPPRMPGGFSRWLDAHPRFVDRFIAYTYVVGQMLMMLVAGSAVAWEYGTSRTIDGRLTLLATVLGVAVVCLALLRRRRLPEMGCAVALSAVYAEPTFFAIANYIALGVFTYTASTEHNNRRGWWCVLIGSVGSALLPLGAAVEYTVPTYSLEELLGRMINTALTTGVYLVIVQLSGMYVGGRRRYLESLLSYAETLKLQRDTRALLAASQERARIAREMHDIIAHSLTVVVTLVEGARVAPPDKSARALELAGDAGREALAEVRRLLGVLREERPAALPAGEGAPGAAGAGAGAVPVPGAQGAVAALASSSGPGPADVVAPAAPQPTASALTPAPPYPAPHTASQLPAYPTTHTETQRPATSAGQQDYAPLAPQPGFAQLGELRERFTAAGLELSWQVPEPLAALDPARELTVYRAVQEALTNALRYAGVGARVSVQLAVLGGEPSEPGEPASTPRISLLVRDYGPADGAVLPPFPGAGRGLAGVRERAALYGGAVSLGPVAAEHGGGFHVLMQLPLPPHMLPAYVAAGEPREDDAAVEAAEEATSAGRQGESERAQIAATSAAAKQHLPEQGTRPSKTPSKQQHTPRRTPHDRVAS